MILIPLHTELINFFFRYGHVEDREKMDFKKVARTKKKKRKELTENIQFHF